MAILTGRALRAYADRYFDPLQADQQDELDARWNERYRVGQLHVVDGVDGIADYLGHLSEWLPDDAIHGSLLNHAEEVRGARGGSGGTRHLVTVVMEWADNHNEGRVLDDEGSWVVPVGPLSLLAYIPVPSAEWVTLDPQDGLVKISAAQCVELTAALELRVREIAPPDSREVSIELLERPNGPVGSAFKVRVNGLDISVPADDDAAGRLVRTLRRVGAAVPRDPVAVTFILGAGWQLNMIFRSGPKVPGACAALLVTSSALVGWSIHRGVEAGREIDPWRVVGASFGLAGLTTVLASRTMRSAIKSDGVQTAPADIILSAMILALNWHRITPRQRGLGLAANAMIVGAGTLLPTPLAKNRTRAKPVDLVLNLMWPLMGVGPIRNVHRSLARETRQLDILRPLQRDYVEAAAELAGTADLSRHAILLLRQAAAAIGMDTTVEEKRLRRLAAIDARRIETHAEALEGAVLARRAVLEREMGVAGGTPHVIVIDVKEALLIADRLAAPVVAVDVENTITGYNPGPEACQNAMSALLDWVDVHTTNIRRVIFVTNSRLHPLSVSGHRVEVRIVRRARKPWIELPPLNALRRELDGAIVCGDQLLTDGLLAHRLHGMFIECPLPRVRPEVTEPLWPRLMRRIGEAVVSRRFSRLSHDSPLLGVSVDKFGDLVPNPMMPE